MPDGSSLRFLDGLAKLLRSDDGKVLLVSSSSLAQRLRAALPDAVSVVAGRATGYDLTPLAGRTLVADGADLAQAALAAGAARAGVVDQSVLTDALDGGATGDALQAAIRAAARKVEPLPPPAPPPAPAAAPPPVSTPAEPPPALHPHDMPPEDDRGGGEWEPPIEDTPYRCLGYDRRRFYFIRCDGDGGQVLELSAPELNSPACLLELAPANHWETLYPGGRGGINATAAANALIASCRRVGIYDPERVRGRGAWLDEGRAVLHMGDRLLVDGHVQPVSRFPTEFLYESARTLPVTLADPLGAAEAKKLHDICSLIGFEDPEFAPIFAGFLVVAPACGAMAWRTHGWLTGEKGSGKTWVLDHIARRVIGSIAMRVASKSTEAGVRQKLASDGRPVIFDEAETQNERDRERVQQILDLARQASSEDGAPIAKGTVGGKAQSFAVRSSFLFSSINLGMTQAADESRTIIFSLGSRKNLSEEGAAAAVQRFTELKRLVAETLTPAWCGGLLARTLSLLPVIRANSETFAQAAAERFGDRRQGDTLGTPLAGFHSLFSSKVLTLDDARRFLEERAWAQRVAGHTETASDQDRALDHLLEQMVRIQPTSGQPIERPLVTVIAAAAAGKANLAGNLDGDAVEGVHPAVAVQHLAFMGIRVEPAVGMVWMARAHSRFPLFFRDTPWSSSWEAQLARIPGAVRVSPKPIRFGQLVKKAVGVPLDAMLKPD